MKSGTLAGTGLCADGERLEELTKNNSKGNRNQKCVNTAEGKVLFGAACELCGAVIVTVVAECPACISVMMVSGEFRLDTESCTRAVPGHAVMSRGKAGSPVTWDTDCSRRPLGMERACTTKRGGWALLGVLPLQVS